MKSIQELLQILGLGTTESELYLTLYEYGRLSAGRLAKLTTIKRTTVYAACDELAKKGLIEINDLGKQRTYQALPAKQLVSYVKKKEDQLKSQKNAAQELVVSLSNIPQSKFIPTPKIRIVQNERIEDFLYDQVPLWEESMRQVSDTTWWGIQDHTFVEHQKYQDWIVWYWSRAPKKYDLKLFSNESVVEEEMKKKKYKNRDIKFWDGEEITATLWILGEYIVSLNTSTSRHYLIQTHDALLAQNMRHVYRKLWKKSKD